MLAGLVLLAVGALAWLSALSWFGRLPGDIRVERPGVRFYAPITSMVIVSLLLTVLAALYQAAVALATGPLTSKLQPPGRPSSLRSGSGESLPSP